MNEDVDLVVVTIRTAGTGHTTAQLSLDALPAFIDTHLAAGRAVVAEFGDESRVIRIGREILDFFLGRRRKGSPKPKEEVTVLSPMAGGSDAAEVPNEEALLTAARVLAMAGVGRSERGVDPNQYGPPQAVVMSSRPMPSTARPLDPAAEMRAWQALVDKESEAAAMPLLHGGAISVRSTLWPAVIYLVRTDMILVVREGQIVSALCLQLTDGGPVWDAVANRLSLLRSGEVGEIQVWTTANVVPR